MSLECAGCGAPLAPDQRYCLECGTRSPHVGGVSGDLQALIASQQPPGPPGPVAAPAPAGVPPNGGHPRSGNTTAVIAGVGVLLLSMGVGVLIGRSSASAPKMPATPAQVISVATSGATNPGTGTTTGQAPAPATTAPSSQKSSPKSGSTGSTSTKPSSKPSAAESGSGGGQTPSKPAPPSVAVHAHGEKGQSYEQKSKNLPNVISTG